MLRFWESRFSQISPMKKGGGRRYYRPEDISLLSGIRALLYDDGLSIKKVQAHIKSSGVSAIYVRGEKCTPVCDGEDAVPPLLPPEKPDAALAKSGKKITAESPPELNDKDSETHERLSGALQKLMDARERLNDTLE